MQIKHLLLSTAMVAATISISTPAEAQFEPFVAQTMSTGANFCPRGWARMEGQLLSISQNTALFSLLGTTYGGDGRTTFALPDTSGRTMIGVGTGPGLATQVWGQKGGSENFTLLESQMPSHTHRAGIRTIRGMATETSPAGNSFANSAENSYIPGQANGHFMAETTLQINNTGGNQAVAKRSPYIAMYQCISLQGIYPSRN